MNANMPYGAFRSDKVKGDKWGVEVANAVLISGHMDAREAMDAADMARRSDCSGRHRYWVADAQYPVNETRAA